MKKQWKQLFAILVGMLLVASAPSIARDPSTSAGAAISGKVTVSGMRDNANVLVYIASVPGNFSPQDAVDMDQRSISFQPHILPIIAGTTVKFLNSDDVQHNVFTPSPAGDFFNLGTWPRGQSKSFTFTKMGKVELLCNVHHEMHGYILVLQNPFFAVTDKEGNFRIGNVPPGNYQLKVWNEHASAAAKPIQISTAPLTVNFELAAR